MLYQPLDFGALVFGHCSETRHAFLGCLLGKQARPLFVGEEAQMREDVLSGTTWAVSAVPQPVPVGRQ